MNTTSPEQELEEVLGLISLFNSIDNDESGNETWLAEAISQLLIEARLQELTNTFIGAPGEIWYRLEGTGHPSQHVGERMVELHNQLNKDN